MADMLVKLYDLPDVTTDLARLKSQSILIRQALPVEKKIVTEWVSQHFYEAWAAGFEWSFTRDPTSCYLAVEIDKTFTPQHPYDLREEKLIGFVCYDTSAKGMFGPMGVDETYQGQGIGRTLLLATLHAMAAE